MRYTREVLEDDCEQSYITNLNWGQYCIRTGEENWRDLRISDHIGIYSFYSRQESREYDMIVSKWQSRLERELLEYENQQEAEAKRKKEAKRREEEAARRAAEEEAEAEEEEERREEEKRKRNARRNKELIDKKAKEWEKAQQGGAAGEPVVLIDDDTMQINVKGVIFNMKFVQGGMLGKYVELSDFFIGETEVTQELWQMVMRDNPSEENDDLKKPVYGLNMAMCKTFITRLKKLTGAEFSVPTTSQWKYAYKGGLKSKGFRYSGSNDLFEVAWTDENSGDDSFHAVGELLPNELGLYDMDGNSAEICKDDYWVPDSYLFNPVLGGEETCWIFEEREKKTLNSATRLWWHVGLRLVINIPVASEVLEFKKSKENS